MSSQATRIKGDCPLEGKCRTENIIYKWIATTSGHPSNIYLGTAEGDLKKKDIITTSVLSIIKHKWIKQPWQKMFGNKSSDIA